MKNLLLLLCFTQILMAQPKVHRHTDFIEAAKFGEGNTEEFIYAHCKCKQETDLLNQLTSDLILKAFFISLTMVYKLRFKRS
jgi:hypothetical protein